VTGPSFLDRAYAAAQTHRSPSPFSDVTTGDNGLYRAGPGYDLVTGLGTPVWTEVEGALTGTAAPVPTGLNEPLLARDPPNDAFAADLTLTQANGFAPNGEPADGYELSAAADSACSSTQS